MHQSSDRAVVGIRWARSVARVQNDQGFTVIELLIVLAIISVLATAAAPKMLEYAQKARDVEAMESLSKMADGATAYYQATGHLPVPPAWAALYPGPLKVSWGYGPSPADICAHGGRATNEDLAVHYRTAAANYSWDQIAFMPGFAARFTYTFSGVSNFVPGAQTAFANLQAERSIDCTGNAGTWVAYRSRLFYQDGALRRTTPHQVRY
ncbi:MAG: prepilin-type N-terminal cleavage/methylation domain-containing protein [Proteobacteria bacterium]|nr:prepilin-type N-terminal cleavage/methylation domain-containing protein [Pseudomonadota bacterium]